MHKKEKKSLIINQPSLQKPVVRGLQVLFSATVWGIFLYFLQTLFTTVAWITSGNFLYSHSISPKAIEGTKNLFIQSCWFAAIVFLLLFSWATWNYWRFGRLERRKARPVIPDEVVALHYNLPLQAVHNAKAAKIATLFPHSGTIDFTVEVPLANTFTDPSV